MAKAHRLTPLTRARLWGTRGEQETTLGAPAPSTLFADAQCGRFYESDPKTHKVDPMHFHCGIFYDNKKTGNKANAVVQPPSGRAHSPGLCPQRMRRSWAKRKSPLPSQAGKQSCLRALTLIPDFPNGGGRGSPRGKWFKQTERTKRAQHQDWLGPRGP